MVYPALLTLVLKELNLSKLIQATAMRIWCPHTVGYVVAKILRTNVALWLYKLTDNELNKIHH